MKTVPGIGAEIDLVMALRDLQRLSQFPGAGTKSRNVFHSPPLSHQFNPGSRLQGSNEDDAIARSALHQDIQHPVDAIIEIDVGRTGSVAPNELTRARATESVTGFVAFNHVSFAFDHEPAAFSPDQLRADEVRRTFQRIDLKEVG